MLKGVRALAVAFFTFAVTGALAFPPIPRASARALGVTRGKSFSTGAVFIHGKYLEPPYVVERWGTGIRINSILVTGQIISWNEFLKTQAKAKAARPPVTKAPTAKSTASEPKDEGSLDGLFDDKPLAEQKPSASGLSTPMPSEGSAETPPEEAFVPNEASQALLARINAARTEIDRILRMGGFICFGESYACVTGDSRALLEMLAKLPELMQQATNAIDFCDRVREARLVYLNEVLREELYANRLDYRKLMELRKKLKRKHSYDDILQDVIRPLL